MLIDGAMMISMLKSGKRFGKNNPQELLDAFPGPGVDRSAVERWFRNSARRRECCDEDDPILFATC
jgi:hypothetical protein